jgi:Skp family chaperone for outer membrane proteins
MSIRSVSKSAVVALALLAGASGAAFAQAAAPAAGGTKIGLVDTRRLITGSAAGKEILARLDKLADEKAEQLKPKQEEIRVLQKKISDGQVSLSEAKLAEMKREMEEKITSGRRLQEDLQKQMEQAQATAFGEFEQKLAPIVEQFGREQGFAFILNVSFFNQPNLPSGLVWASDQSDVTDALIKKIDAVAPKP